MYTINIPMYYIYEYYRTHEDLFLLKCVTYKYNLFSIFIITANNYEYESYPRKTIVTYLALYFPIKIA